MDALCHGKVCIAYLLIEPSLSAAACAQILAGCPVLTKMCSCMDSHGQSQPETPVGCSLYSLSTHLLGKRDPSYRSRSIRQLQTPRSSRQYARAHYSWPLHKGFWISKCEVSPRSLATTSLLCQLLDVVEVAKFPTPESITNSLKRFPHHELVLMHAATYHLS